MSVTSWNDEEDRALQGLPVEAQLLYLRGLRRHMDYGTGIVGERRRISWKMLAEILEVEPHQGAERTGQPHISKVRRLMQWLIKAGLVEDIGSKKRGQPIVFRLPMASMDTSVRKKPDKNPTRTRQTFSDKQPDIETAIVNHGVAEQPDKQPDKDGERVFNSDYQKPDTHPVSGIKNPPTGDFSIGHPGPSRASKTASRFDEFWSAYPKKVGKKACLAKWKARCLDEIADRLIADVKRRTRHHRPWIEGYVPNPLTYINQDRWEDEIEPVRKMPSSPAHGFHKAEMREDANRQAAEAFLRNDPRRTPKGLVIDVEAEEEIDDERPRQAALR